MAQRRGRVALSLVLLLAGFSLGVTTRADGEEEYFYCTSEGCPAESRCPGMYTVSAGNCKITCAIAVFGPGGGYIGSFPNGTADCSPPEY